MAGSSAESRERWREFLTGQHADDIDQLAARYPDDRSLYVDVIDLHDFDPRFTSELLSNPDRILQLGSAVLRDLRDDIGRVNVRLRNHPGLLAIENLRVRHAGEIVTVEGTATTVADSQARIDVAEYECSACGEAVRTRSRGHALGEPLRCDACGEHSSMQLRRSASRFIDVQRIVLESIQPMGEPATIETYLDDDLVGAVDRGEEVVLTGILRLEETAATNRFDFYLDGISVEESRGLRADEDRDAVEGIQDLIAERWEFAVGR